MNNVITRHGRGPFRRPAAVALTVAAVASGLSIGVAPPVSAATTIQVTTTADSMNPFDGKTSLREAVQKANLDQTDTTILLAAGMTYTLTRCSNGPEEKNRWGDLDHWDTNWLFIDGGTGAQPIITTRCKDRHLDNLDTAALAIRNVKLTNGDAALDYYEFQWPTPDNAGGGSIESMGPVVVINAWFDKNRAFQDAPNPGVVPSATGGGIAANFVWAVASSFTNNASDDGGGIGDRFDDAGSSYNSTGWIDGSIFEGNTSSLGAGMLEQISLIGNSRFTRNDAGIGGGVLGRVGTISATTFEENSASWWGGDAYLVGDPFPFSNPSLGAISVISDSTFTGSDAGACGAIATRNLSLVRTEVSASTAQYYAGGLCAIGQEIDTTITLPALLNIESSTFLGNTAGTYGGGALAQGVTTIDKSLFVDNAAGSGGNYSGGGLDHYSRTSPPGDLRISASQFDANSAHMGGGIATDGSGFTGAAKIENTSVLNNVATNSGGGIALWGGLQLTHTTVAGNTAPNGAALADIDPLGAFWLRANALEGDCDVAVLPVSAGRNTDDSGSCGLATASGDLPFGTAFTPGPLFTVGTTSRPTLVESWLAEWINPNSCSLPVDQVGQARPWGWGCTPGAIEAKGQIVWDPLDDTKLSGPSELGPPSDSTQIGPDATLGGSTTSELALDSARAESSDSRGLRELADQAGFGSVIDRRFNTRPSMAEPLQPVVPDTLLRMLELRPMTASTK